MRRYNLEVLTISETHWTQVGQQRLASGELQLYSGYEKENASYTQGVALMLSKQAQNALIRSTIEDVRTKRGADIASDHHLLVAKMKLKLKKHWTTGRTISQTFNTAFLQDTNKLN
ncbi:unnamed protein product [Schistosoma margrebowiei]|uniref:Uncharacterized protein n=1 Tax=Schistosoma margrebowiei TaxID=48269 RepID=A0A183N4W7_9TREM|nr:unnamed protein product [Schistosoma margrebowiei]